MPVKGFGIGLIRDREQPECGFRDMLPGPDGRQGEPAAGMMDGHTGDGEALMEAEAKEEEVGQRTPDTGPKGGQTSPWCTFPTPGGLLGLSVEGGSAKEMGPLSKKLYEHKLLTSLLFKGLILHVAGDLYVDEKVGPG